MNLDLFVKQFASQFEETELSEFTKDTDFKDLDEWNSLMGLAIIGFVDDEYNVQIKGEDIRKSETIEDLYKVIESRK